MKWSWPTDSMAMTIIINSMFYTWNKKRLIGCFGSCLNQDCILFWSEIHSSHGWYSADGCSLYPDGLRKAKHWTQFSKQLLYCLTEMEALVQTAPLFFWLLATSSISLKGVLWFSCLTFLPLGQFPTDPEKNPLPSVFIYLFPSPYFDHGIVSPGCRHQPYLTTAIDLLWRGVTSDSKALDFMRLIKCEQLYHSPISAVVWSLCYWINGVGATAHLLAQCFVYLGSSVADIINLQQVVHIQYSAVRESFKSNCINNCFMYAFRCICSCSRM